MAATEMTTAATASISAADTAWLLVSCALVLLMTPGLAFFYGGLVRSKNILNTMMMSFASLGVTALVWFLAAYSLAFAPGSDAMQPWVGGLGHLFLQGVNLEANGSIPHLLFAAYQGAFAIITAALISGAVVERIRFGPYLVFICGWVLLVYAPVCHWVWGGGWLGELGALDFAGGTVVHVTAGTAAVVAAWQVGPRSDFGRQAIIPHNVPFVLLGAGLLWFGWFGFNGGSALAADGSATLAFVNTLLAPATALTVWMILDAVRDRMATAVGAATGIVVGLVAVTPAAGFVSPLGAVAIGAIATFPCYYAILYRSRSGLDDSLDVAAAHGMGGLSGAILTGVFAHAVWGGSDGLLYGNPMQVVIQAVGVLATIVYCGVVTWMLLKVISLFGTLRPLQNEERTGLDILEHGEDAYGRGEGATMIPPGSTV
jgi:Amt family ammonium transporter